ncbi:MAG TPA: hypothetical protein VJ746_00505 [Nitrospira sp.]|nr:hypothetical protein [Nitrospira sp.]
MSQRTDIPPDWQTTSEGAKNAACQGRWDEVARYYAERESWIRRCSIPDTMACRLAAIDREIESMIAAARAAAGALIDEASCVRRKLGRLWRQCDAAGGLQARVSRRM